MKRFVCVLLLLVLLASFATCCAEEAIAVDAVLSADDYGEALFLLQIDLIGKGYLSGSADGMMGPATEKAIREAQEDYGLVVSGYMTEELSNALLRKAFPLRRDSRSSLVYQLQQKLYNWGFLTDDPTGYFGKSTQEAVTSAQKFSLESALEYMQNKADEEYAVLSVADDVIVDQKLYNADTVPCDGVVTEEWYEFLMNVYELPGVTAQRDDRGEDVKLMQKKLHSLGYLYTGMDGVFGNVTELALKYFQRKNGLPETGVCNIATSDLLFSGDAVESDEYVMPYMAYVKRAESRVYIFGWDGEGYNTPVIAFKCSCGAPRTPTIEGTFYAVGPISDWYYMQDSNVWVQYAFQIQGNYFFHSVLFNTKGAKKPTSTSVAALGTNVSHGCIRLAVDDVKWIYDNCTAGMKVVIE